MAKKKKKKDWFENLLGISAGTAILIILVLILIIYFFFPDTFAGIQNFIKELFSLISLTITGGGNGYGTDNPEGTLPPPKTDCTQYDFNAEFTRYFGEPNMQILIAGCNAMSGTFTRTYNEVGCDYSSAWMVDCTDPRLTYFENFCNYLHGTYICDNNLYHYVGCLCNKYPPLEQQQEEEDQQPEYTCAWHEDIATGGYCDGTCPTGKYCEMITYGQCECVYPDEQMGKVGTIFVTSLKWSGAMGGLAGMDAKCQQSAVSAGLSGTWKAIASDSTTNANSRLPDIAYYNMNGLLIANNKADLFDGSIANFINIDEYYVNVGVSDVWTGTDLAGNSYGSGDLTLNCHNWGWVSDGYFGIVGSTGSNGIGWIENTVVKECKLSARIYCARTS